MRPRLPFAWSIPALVFLLGGCGPEDTKDLSLDHCRVVSKSGSGMCTIRANVGPRIELLDNSRSVYSADDVLAQQLTVSSLTPLDTKQYDLQGRLDSTYKGAPMLKVVAADPVTPPTQWIPLAIGLLALGGLGYVIATRGKGWMGQFSGRGRQGKVQSAADKINANFVNFDADRIGRTEFEESTKISLEDIAVPRGAHVLLVDRGDRMAPIPMQFGFDHAKNVFCDDPVGENVTIYQVTRRGDRPPPDTLSTGLPVHHQLQIDDPTRSVSRDGNFALLVDESNNTYVVAREGMNTPTLISDQNNAKWIGAVARQPHKIVKDTRIRVRKVTFVYRKGDNRP